MLENLQKLIGITIEEYTREIEVSKKQNPKYFYWDGTTIRAKGKKVWKKLLKKGSEKAIALNDGNITPAHLRDGYEIWGFKGSKAFSILSYVEPTIYETHFAPLTEKQKKRKTKYFLVDGDTGERIIANPTQVGTSKTLVVSGQGLYSGIYNPFQRNKMVDDLKEMYYQKFLTIDWNMIEKMRKIVAQNYPIWITVEIQDTVKKFNDKTKEGHGRRWDVSNLAYPYLKTFTDFLVEGYDKTKHKIPPIIEDDDRLHVIGDGSFFTPIDEGEKHKIIFSIYADKRAIWEPILNL